MSNHPVQQLAGLTDEQLAELTRGISGTAMAAYWAAIEEAIGKAMIEGRIWNGEDGTAEASRDFIRGQIGFDAPGDGRGCSWPQGKSCTRLLEKPYSGGRKTAGGQPRRSGSPISAPGKKGHRVLPPEPEKTSLDFSEALRWLKIGRRVARAGWTTAYLQLFRPLKASPTAVPYSPGADSLLAEDWELIARCPCPSCQGHQPADDELPP